ncbi:MAG TPA: UDP-3-O-(3-hydroxymyristoyl)glucosamine N-acyltransferase [Caulobacteraceae bacterium]|nr:UDP-3-O-(3-hydroxymyristoyl)glucosamine N-acyltransferase [Caulobacteraceae bacterium]
MPDPRFFEVRPPASLGELAALVGARLADPEAAGRLIQGVASLTAATPGDVAFCADRRHAADLGATAAGACFVAEVQAGAAPPTCVVLVTPLPQAAYAAAADRLFRPWTLAPGAPPVDPSAEIEDGVTLAPGAVVGPRARLGRGTVVGPGAYVGPGVAVGRDCAIGARAVVGFALLGDRVRILAGAVIGEPGFGAAAGPRGVIDIPQLGRVILQDGVTVGANSCIDRGAFGDTVIGENTKIDNLVQIGHNVVIGRNCLLAAHTGISGSTVIGDGCMLGGRVGIADHITVGPGARLAAAAGVMNDIPAGESWGGFPARPMIRWMRETATLTRLARRRWKDVDGA